MMSTGVRAPEFPEGLTWFNTSWPIQLSELRGKLVLLDFWTYCCTNCMHVLPGLKRLEEKYRDQLVVIGVHSGKFSNEKVSENIRQAILRNEIRHPVVNDADLIIWRSYTVRAWPTIVLIDPGGYILAAVPGESDFEEMDRALNQIVTLYRENGTLAESATHFASEQAQDQVLSYPGKVLVDPQADLIFISDTNHNRIVIARPDGTIVDSIGSGEQSAADGAFEQATFNRPQGLALVGQSLFVADTENHLIRHCDLKTRSVSTPAGTGQQARQHFLSGRGRSVPLNSPWDLWFFENFLYIAMAGAHQIWRLDLGTLEVSAYAGSGREGRIDGPLGDAAMAQPSGLTSDGRSLFVADSETSSIRAVSLGPPERVDTLVGVDLFEFGDIDGKGDTVRLQHPLGVAWHDGLIYVADTYNHKIKVLHPEKLACVTLAGAGQPGDRDGHADHCEFYEPGGLSFRGRRLYVADTNNHRIRTIDLDSLQVGTLGLRERKLARASASVMVSEKGDSGAALPAKEKRLSPVDLKTGIAGFFQVEISLEGSATLNPEAPVTVHLKSNLLAWPSASNNSWTIEPARTHFSIPFQTRDLSSEETVRLEAVVSYCLKETGLCKACTLRWLIPVRLSPTSANTVVELSQTVG